MMRYVIFAFVVVLAGAARAQQAPFFYSYTNDSGRTVYVNRFALVPPEKRAEARAVDLSQVSLNPRLADELSDAVETELRQLKESDPCNEARRERNASVWRHLWHRHGPWVLVSVAALVLVLMSPWMVRRTPAGLWARFLMVALPALAMTVLMAISVTRATDSLEAVRELATLCEANEKEAAPRKQLMRLNEMHAYIDELYKEQYESIERATSNP